MKIAVIGASGQVGMTLSLELNRLGHKVVAISRGRTPANKSKLDILQTMGMLPVFQEDLADIKRMTTILSGCDIAIVAMRANARLVRQLGPPILEAAIEARVRRFVPDEFGTNTKCLHYGVGTLFDAKKEFHERVFASGLEWTLLFPGGIFDYFLPNLRLFERITTFGNLDCTFPTHSLKDIGSICARAVIDPRAANRAVQIYANVVSQRQLLQVLKSLWPHYPFEFEHVSTETIMYLKEHGDPVQVSARGGAEPDKERHGINYATYVLGKLACLDDPETLNANELYPDHVYIKPEEALADPKFVFGYNQEHTGRVLNRENELNSKGG